MAQIEFVVPEAVTNYFTNPRLGTGDTTGLTAVSSALTSVLTRARWGVYSVRVVTTGAGLSEGCYATVTFGAPGADEGAWAGSVYLRGSGSVRVRLLDNTNLVQQFSEEVVLNDDRWTRVGIEAHIPSGCLDMRLYIETTRVQATTFYVDGIQFEPNGYITTYTDGDRELELPPHDGAVYYKWNGTLHASTSTRSAACRTGGRTEEIEIVNTQLLITDTDGLGMPPIDLHLTQLASSDRGRVDSWRAIPRVVNLHFFVRRDENGEVCFPADLSEIHEQRQKLETIVKPDKAPNSQPMLMRYNDGHDLRKLELFVYYEGGLEWSGDIRFPFLNDFVVRFLAVDPYWYEDTQDVYSPTGTQTLADADYIVARINGEWTEIGDTDGNVFIIKKHPNGDIYAGGAFTTIDGVTANTAYIARWDGSAWNSLGGAANALNGNVRAIDFLNDGRVILGGNFTTFGATTANRVAIYTPSTDSFATAGAGPGFDEAVYDFAVRDDGDVYVVGQFVQDGGAVTTYNRVARYDTSANTFATMGPGPGLDAFAGAVAIDNDGLTAYIGGVFQDEAVAAGLDLDSLAIYDAATNTFDEMGTGLNAVTYVYDLLCAHDNKVYAVGQFTHIGFMDVGYIGVWTGNEWYPLGAEGDGFTFTAGGSAIRILAENYKNLIFIGGDMGSATDSALFRGFGSWNGSRFQHWDLVMPTFHVYTILPDGDDIWIGFNNNGTSYASEVFTVDNVGRTTTYPTLEILGPCYLQWLENQTTGQIVRIDLDILAGERVIFDFKPWNRFVRSTTRGNVIKSILADSDELHLLPGDNILAMYCDDTDGNTEISLRWPIIHWSFDDLR